VKNISTCFLPGDALDLVQRRQEEEVDAGKSL